MDWVLDFIESLYEFDVEPEPVNAELFEFGNDYTEENDHD